MWATYGSRRRAAHMVWTCTLFVFGLYVCMYIMCWYWLYIHIQYIHVGLYVYYAMLVHMREHWKRKACARQIEMFSYSLSMGRHCVDNGAAAVLKIIRVCCWWTRYWFCLFNIEQNTTHTDTLTKYSIKIFP